MKYFFCKNNVSLATADGVEARKSLAEREGFDIRKLTCGEQVHSANVVVVDAPLVGRGALDLESRIPECDALVTNIKGVCLMMLTADCVPILLYDKEREVVASIHAGWKGTAAKIAIKTVDTMKERFGCKAMDIEAFIGPSICGQCFEVGDEVVAAIGEQYISGMSKNGKALLDLKFANTMQLIEAGLELDWIRVSGECTYHDGLFSWRRDKTIRRIGSGIYL
ncbi:MAG: peptidoglycan editing factor PgeF [Bacteroidales bacterium]|nr:peptidoglycan editing factor PgeF [Bacteroidales bacterium]